MAYIESFVVHGLAGRKKPVQRVLDRHVNVFWGLNGSGKTSLLKILHAALENDTASLERVPFDRAEVFIRTSGSEQLVLRSFDKTAVPHDTIEFDSQDEVELSGWYRERRPWSSSWSTTVLDDESVERSSSKFQHAYLPISRVSQTRASSSMSNWRSSVERQAIDDAAFDEIFAEQVRRRWQAYSNNALSQIREIQQQGLAAILAILFGGRSATSYEMAETVGGEQAFALVRNFLKEQRIALSVGKPEFLRRYDDESELREVVTKIQDVTEEVHDALRPQEEFQAIIEELYSGDKHLVLAARAGGHRNSLQVEINGQSIPLQSLSSGEKQLLQLLLEILAADANTVMIDEPELSMHVDWQQKLVASMQRVNPQCQLLLATHSPEVMADVADAYVFEL